MGQAEELRQLIRAAFPPQRFYGPVTNGCTCDECTELDDSLRHKSWDALDDSTMNTQFGSLPLLSPQAFGAFLPAWLARSIDALEADQQKFREWTLYALVIYHDDEYNDADELPIRTDELRRRYEGLTLEQVGVIKRFLLLIRDHARISEWDRESINRTLPLLREQ